jgi:hypothetical protein
MNNSVNAVYFSQCKDVLINLIQQRDKSIKKLFLHSLLDWFQQQFSQF